MTSSDHISLPQWPWSVYGHMHTSQQRSSFGKAALSLLSAVMTGVSSLSAWVPRSSCVKKQQHEIKIYVLVLYVFLNCWSKKMMWIIYAFKRRRESCFLNENPNVMLCIRWHWIMLNCLLYCRNDWRDPKSVNRLSRRLKQTTFVLFSLSNEPPKEASRSQNAQNRGLSSQWFQTLQSCTSFLFSKRKKKI